MAQVPQHREDTLDTIANALVCCTWEYWVWSALQLAIDHDDDGMTFDKHGPDKLGNFCPSGGSLSSGVSFLHG